MDDNVIDDISLGKLYEAAASSGDKEMQDRNKTLLSVFDHTGARLDEALNLTRTAILTALELAGEGEIVLILLRSRHPLHGDTGKLRRYLGSGARGLIPVPKHIVVQWAEYIHTSRSSCVGRKEGDDDGCLLVSTRTGESLRSGAVIAILRDLSEAAGLAKPVAVQMIRNKFPDRIYGLIMQHLGSGTVDDYLAFKNALKRLSGHASKNFLSYYLLLNYVNTRLPKE
ncbi:hypothetical protein [Pseudomonas taiwanensis]|uniref:Uncharacterized protein n=1 Tax=Pseudomonas taiwanensis TaxID=470150 RepID=A0ABR6V5Q1_9PSED|nr:hypothetical protein [Pseudomonas taiwanensis]MBC3475718.1 hypothetical protein [Pseudomonas taiwanensis]